MTHPRRLSRELRHARGPDMRRRRQIIGLSLAGVAIGGIVSAYQTGLVRRLPDPSFGPFDSERLNASETAYSRMQVPDGLLMIVTYGVTAALAAAGPADRSRVQPALPVAMATKSLYDLVTALRLAQTEYDDKGAFCIYCQTATVTTLLSTLLSLPEAADGLRRLARGDRRIGLRPA